jgi:hypothetical protein
MASILFEIPGIVPGRFFGFLLEVVIFILTLYYISANRNVFIRRVAAIDAIEEAIGRSVEMGKPVVFSYGIASRGFDLRTLVGIALLGHVARMCARSEARIIVPTGGSEGSYIVRPTVEETVKTAYTIEGKPELYNPDDIPFFSGQQYAYVGGYIGMMQRNPPGAVIACSHASEHLNIAETATSLGAITINAPSSSSKVAETAGASDYLIFPEEAPAAAAYLSKDPMEVGSIKVQDYLKYVAIILIIAGLIVATGGGDFITRLLST